MALSKKHHVQRYIIKLPRQKRFQRTEHEKVGGSRVREKKKRLTEGRRNTYGHRVKKKRRVGSLVLTYKRPVML